MISPKRRAITKLLVESGGEPVVYRGLVYTKEYVNGGVKAMLKAGKAKIAKLEDTVPGLSNASELHRPFTAKEAEERGMLKAPPPEKISDKDLVSSIAWLDMDRRDELWDHFLGCICVGAKLHAYCRVNKISLGAMFNFMGEPGRKDQYEQARNIYAQKLMDEIVDIAENADDAHIAKLRIDARKHLASKLDKARYGEAKQADQNVGVTVVIKQFGPASNEQH